MAEDIELEQADKLVQESVGYKASPGLCAVIFAVSGVLGLLASVSPKLATLVLLPCPLSRADWVLLKLIDGRLRLAKVVKFMPSNKAQGSHAFCMDEVKLHTFRLFLRLYVYDPVQLTFRPVPRMPRHLPHQIGKALKFLHLIETAGASWKAFNVEHTHRRKDITKLYGNKKRLLSKGLEVKSTNGLLPLFWIQSMELAFLAYQNRWFYPVLCWTLTLVVGYLFGRFKQAQDRKIMSLVNTVRPIPILNGGFVRAVSSHRLVPGDVIVLQRGRALCDMALLRGTCLVVETTLSGEAAAVRKVNFVPDEGVMYNPDRHSSSTIYAGTTVQQVWNAEGPEEEVLAMVVRTGFHTVMGAMVQELVAPTKGFTEKKPFTPDVLRIYLFGVVVHLFILIPYFIKVSEHHQATTDVVVRVLSYLVYAVPPGAVTIMACSGLIARSRLLKDGLMLLYPETLALAADLDMVCFDKTGTLTQSNADLHGVLPVKKQRFEPLQQTAVSWSTAMRQAAAVCNSLTLINRSTVVGPDMERDLFKTVEARFQDRKTVVLPRKPDQHSHRTNATLQIIKILEFSSQTLRSGVVISASDGPPGSARLFLKGAPAVIRDLVQPSSLPADFNQVVDDYSAKSFRLMAVATGMVTDVDRLDLANMSQQAIEAAATDMELLALIILANSIRSDTVSTMKELQGMGGLHTLIITGDYHHTALAIAKQAGMLTVSEDVVIVDTHQQSKPPVQACVTHLLADHATSSLTQLAAPPPIDELPTRVAEAGMPIKLPLSMLNHAVSASSMPTFTFMSSQNNEELEQSQALAALAEGRAQCAVTGPAFAGLLQQQDLSLLEVVLRSAVVFARMQPHQKGQVMDMVTVRGLDLQTKAGPRYVPGLGHTAMFCGDGINDLAALAAADVGLAVGATDATIAAAVISSRPSIASTLNFIKMGRAAHAMLISLFKYMMIYQFALAEANVLTFWMDGSSLTHGQDTAIDFQAMTMVLAALLVLPLPELNRHKPPIRICTRFQLIHMAIMAPSLFAIQIVLMAYMASRPWFQGGTGTARENTVTTEAWLTCNAQLLAPLVGLTIDTSLFCQSIFRSRLLLSLAVFYMSYAYIGMLSSPPRAFPSFGLSHDLPRSFRNEWCGIVVALVPAYVVIVNGTRRLLRRSEQRKTHPQQ